MRHLNNHSWLRPTQSCNRIWLLFESITVCHCLDELNVCCSINSHRLKTLTFSLYLFLHEVFVAGLSWISGNSIIGKFGERSCRIKFALRSSNAAPATVSSARTASPEPSSRRSQFTVIAEGICGGVHKNHLPDFLLQHFREPKGEMKMHRLFQLIVCFALILTTPFALSQDENEGTLEEVVVTATRIPTPLTDTLPTTSVLTSEDIERLKPQELGDLLGRSSGIGFRDSGGRGSQGSLFIRGTTNKHVLVLINGIRTSSATLGATAIENISLESIERIEIVKGPMSGVYGSDAIGGVIQIFTKQNYEEESFATVNSTVGSNSLRKYGGRAGYSDTAYSVSASVSKESTEGIDRTKIKTNENGDKDGFEQTSGNFSLTTQLHDLVDLKFNHVQSTSRLEYDSSFGSKANGWHQRARLETTSLNVEYDHSDALNIVGTVGTSKDFSTQFANERSYINTRKADYSVQGNLILDSQNQISMGIDYQKDTVGATNSYSKSNRANKGFFALWQFQGDRISSVLNSRHDINSDYGSISNYSFQQAFDITDSYSVVASYGTAFKAPTFNDLFWPVMESEFFGTTYRTEGNPDVISEESKSFELSLKAELGQLYWQINAYETKVKNLIEWQTTKVQENPDVNLTKPANIKSATLKGVEVELTKQWDDYLLKAGLDYLDAKDGDTGNFLDDRARTSGSLEIGKQFDSLYVGVDAFFEHSRFDRARRLPEYTLWGISGSYEFSDSLTISGHIDNLFDKEYVTNLASNTNPYQNEGRTIQVSLEYKF